MTARMVSDFLAKVTREAIENGDVGLAGTAIYVLATVDPHRARDVYNGIVYDTICEAEAILEAAP